MNRRVSSAFVAALALVCLVPFAHAQSAADTPKGKGVMGACQPDLAAYCGGVEKGSGRKIACLKDNKAKLSLGCTAAIGEVLDKRADRLSKGRGDRAACKGDIATLCAGVEKGEGRIGQCMKANEAKLSPACAASRAEKKAQRLAMKSACAADKKSLCGGAQKGALKHCFVEKRAQLSLGCVAALDALPARTGKPVDGEPSKAQ
jgi:Cysteine rich repeat